jgi:hypothetical protein
MLWLVRGSGTKSRGMTDLEDYSPRRYFVDAGGRRVLVGLTSKETFEFETLDCLPALDESGNRVALGQNGAPTSTREKRWLELYTKHDNAWREWIAKSHGDGDSTIINQDSVT